jgi:hypothetical protein
MESINHKVQAAKECGVPKEWQNSLPKIDVKPRFTSIFGKHSHHPAQGCRKSITGRVALNHPGFYILVPAWPVLVR